MAQMKEQNKTPEKELNKMETSQPLDSEFKAMVIRMLNEFRGKADELRENFNSIKKDKKTIKKEPVRNEEYTN